MAHMSDMGFARFSIYNMELFIFLTSVEGEESISV